MGIMALICKQCATLDSN